MAAVDMIDIQQLKSFFDERNVFITHLLTGHGTNVSHYSFEMVGSINCTALNIMLVCFYFIQSFAMKLKSSQSTPEVQDFSQSIEMNKPTIPHL